MRRLIVVCVGIHGAICLAVVVSIIVDCFVVMGGGSGFT